MAVDVVVAGGGPAGAATALALCGAGWSVVLVDDARRARAPAAMGEDLPPAARPVLCDLGVWDAFRASGLRACPGNDSAWGSARLASTDFVFDPNGNGWHLDRGRFDPWLRAQAACAGADIRPLRVLHANRDGRGWVVTIEGGEPQRCRWIVDATGRHAALARHHGARRRTFDSTVTLVANVAAGPDDTDGRTLVESAPDGWWYTARMPAASRTIAYITDRDLAPCPAARAEGFTDLLASTTHVRRRADPGTRAGPPRQVAANTAVLTPAAGDGWIAVGDAALAVDPLSSTGILNALVTGVRAAEAIVSGDVDGYVRRIDHMVDRYRRDLASYYALEQRWPDRPFWQRRGPGILHPVAARRSGEDVDGAGDRQSDDQE